MWTETSVAPTEAGEDESSSNDDKGLKGVGVHQSSQATCQTYTLMVYGSNPRRDLHKRICGIIVEAVRADTLRAFTQTSAIRHNDTDALFHADVCGRAPVTVYKAVIGDDGDVDVQP